MNRRNFSKACISTGISAAALTGLYTWQVEPFLLEYVHVNMPIKNLPKQLIGKTLMQISDIHVGNRFDYQYLIDAFKAAQKLSPDFVVYTGDYVSYEGPEQKQQLKTVLNHSVTGTIGTCGILGNHDYGKNWAEQSVADEITSLLENASIQVLSNNQLNFEGLNIIGLDDFWGLNFKPELVMPFINHDEANLVLCHNPDVCDEAIWHDYNGWILSGHTHGGQCKPPFLPPPMLPVKNKSYSAGQINLNDGRTLYINRALGHLWQVRFNVRPEITVFTLANA